MTHRKKKERFKPGEDETDKQTFKRFRVRDK